MNADKVISNIRTELKTYIVDNNLKSLVVGVSGGIDSALICAIVKPICDELKIPLIGRSLPIKTNKENEIKNANLIGEHFCTDFKEVNLENLFDFMIANTNQTEQFTLRHILNHNSYEGSTDAHEDYDRLNKIREGNIKARIRMIHLYNLAFMNKGMVLSTDNKTEEMLGFFTICGDVGDYSPIQNLWKTEVYDLSRHLVDEFLKEKQLGKAYALQSCIDIIPTDGLGITSSDVEQLGVSSYKVIDKILQEYLQLKELLSRELVTDQDIINRYNSLLDHAIIKRHTTTHFKRNWPNRGLDRDELFNR